MPPTTPTTAAAGSSGGNGSAGSAGSAEQPGVDDLYNMDDFLPTPLEAVGNMQSSGVCRQAFRALPGSNLSAAV